MPISNGAPASFGGIRFAKIASAAKIDTRTILRTPHTLQKKDLI